ncbi:MAG TPA: response regulator receiver protein [Phycisphaerales bacterium]|nr:response regulator receiver protein [Phycisphaerales bacterium]
MKLISEIIEILSSDTGKLSDALIKTKVLLHKIGHKELVPWVNSELNGYPDRDSVPEYRVLQAQVLVNASNGAYRVTSHHIPMGHLDKKHRESIETARMDQSLAVLEKFTEKDTGHLQAHIPMESYGILDKGLGNSYEIESAWSEIGHTSVLQILTQVRSRLLDFILELNDQFPNELNEEEVKERISNVDAENLFNSAIFGDNTTILVGSSNTQTVSNVNIKGDFSALAKTLENNGVSDSDITALKDAIDQDSSVINDDSKEFGPAVKSWLQTMLSKAVETSWKIELGIASSLLATALNSFYGWF